MSFIQVQAEPVVDNCPDVGGFNDFFLPTTTPQAQ